MIFFLDYKKYFKVRHKGHEIISDVYDVLQNLHQIVWLYVNYEQKQSFVDEGGNSGKFS